jgi:thioredoxin-related protein
MAEQAIVCSAASPPTLQSFCAVFFDCFTYPTPQCSIQLVVQAHIDFYNMTQLTFHDCFEHPHPTIPVLNLEEMQKKRVSTSSKHVKAQDPPRVLIGENVNNWVKIANDFLQSPEAKSPSSELSQGALDPVKSLLRNEADVRREADRYIMPPLISALRTKYPNLELLENAEMTFDPLRTDVTITTANEIYFTNGKDVVLIIEYKRCGYIHNEEFKDAFRDEKDLQKVLIDLDVEDLESTLDKTSNAIKFVKQGTAYSRTTSCKYVALCDYEHLIFIRYREDGSLDSAYATVVPRDKFLKALLGFGIDACQKVIDRVQ